MKPRKDCEPWYKVEKFLKKVQFTVFYNQPKVNLFDKAKLGDQYASDGQLISRETVTMVRKSIQDLH